MRLIMSRALPCFVRSKRADSTVDEDAAAPAPAPPPAPPPEAVPRVASSAVTSMSWWYSRSHARVKTPCMSFSACVRAASRPTGWGVRSQTSEVAQVHTCSSGVRYREPCDLPRGLQTQEREWTQCSAAPASRSLPRPQTAHTIAARTRQSHLHSVWMQHGRSVSSWRDCETPDRHSTHLPSWRCGTQNGRCLL